MKIRKNSSEERLPKIYTQHQLQVIMFAYLERNKAYEKIVRKIFIK
jgi:hypothetical protein